MHVWWGLMGRGERASAHPVVWQHELKDLCKGRHLRDVLDIVALGAGQGDGGAAACVAAAGGHGAPRLTWPVSGYSSTTGQCTRVVSASPPSPPPPRASTHGP